MNNRALVASYVELARIANRMALGARRLGLKSKASLYRDRAKRHMAAAREFKGVASALRAAEAKATNGAGKA